ncbi:MAG: glycoside hydrolase family 3 protein [Spirochaetaceae bacterium]|nr:glycoside hydrolase family 3 protein [Spirochaetaceae bacterium]
MVRKNTIQRRKSLFLLVSLCLFLSCSGKEGESKTKQTAESSAPSQEEMQQVLQQQQELQKQQAQQAALQQFIQSLDPVQRYSQLFLVNLEGNTIFRPVESLTWEDSPEQALVPGGYLFFSYNVADSAQKVADFTASIQSWCQSNQKLPPLLAIDQEGGLVNRLRAVTSPLPSAQDVAATMTYEEAQELYRLQGSQMQNLGFHLNLAPVAEATSSHNQAFLDTRSYGPLPQMEDYARAAIAGFQEGGIGAVAKHFPGNTNDDPHTGLPEISLSQQELQELYLEPFRRILQESKPWAVLMSHARTAVYDGENPACLSRFWVTQMLRQDFGYQGLILSDDIFMAALEKNGFPPERSVMMAVEAGIDVIMLSEKKFGSVLKLILDRSREDESFKSLLDASVERILLAKVQAGLMSFQEEGEQLKLVVNSSPKVWSQESFQTAYQQGVEHYTAAFGGTK